MKNDLSEYWGKTIKVNFLDGDTLIGFAELYEDVPNSEDGIESLSLTGTPIGKYVNVRADEIESIEILQDDN